MAENLPLTKIVLRCRNCAHFEAYKDYEEKGTCDRLTYFNESNPPWTTITLPPEVCSLEVGMNFGCIHFVLGPFQID
jgi:hypothetical protein